MCSRATPAIHTSIIQCFSNVLLHQVLCAWHLRQSKLLSWLDQLCLSELVGYERQNNLMLEGGASEFLRSFSSSLLPPGLSDPGNSSSSRVVSSSWQQALNVIDYKGAFGSWCYSNSSLVEQGDGLPCSSSNYVNLDPEDDYDASKRFSFDMTPGTVDSWLIEDRSYAEMVSAYSSMGGRVEERLRVLQDIVANGAKAMLEKAINHVKFLQMQVKVLETDEFWSAQGGKAAEGGY
ncbi:transcription factor RHD6-like [Musa acuminata AAA Group]|uniref:transcription factor RHD6-like n=1 Tax=Musa acuminata AAA Group TaxID=214697 RepID=UPI0031E249FA